MGKINFLVIGVFFILFILLVNAAESYEKAETKSSNSNDLVVNNSDQIENLTLSEKKPTAVTVSFGVYLGIVG